METTTPKLIPGPYYQDILDQPRALEATLAALTPDPALDAIGARLRTGSFRRLLLTGMGSSFHGLWPLHLQLAARGIASTLMETSELIHYGQGLLDASTLVIAVSQSGSSAETLRLLELGNGATILGVTNTEDSPLARRSTARVLTRAGAEHTVSCKTYVCALTVLRWLGEVLAGGDPTGTLAELRQAPALVAASLKELDATVAHLAHTLKDVRSLFLVGRGDSLATTGTGALITKEAARFHAEGMSSAAFRHGPLEMVNPDMYVLVLRGDATTRALNERLLADILQHGGRGALLDIDPAPQGLRPVLEILHVQAITLALASLSGREAGAFRWATKVTTTE
jgi:glutamine---fructose-6-phosphate transaminase (isomerizing)